MAVRHLSVVVRLALAGTGLAAAGGGASAGSVERFTADSPSHWLSSARSLAVSGRQPVLARLFLRSADSALIIVAIVSGGGERMWHPLTYGEVRRRELFHAMFVAWVLGLALMWRWWSSADRNRRR